MVVVVVVEDLGDEVYKWQIMREVTDRSMVDIDSFPLSVPAPSLRPRKEEERKITQAKHIVF